MDQIARGDSERPRIVKEGWLRKRGIYVKNWRERYFILFEDGVLFGYRGRPDLEEHPDPRNTFNVREHKLTCVEKPRPFAFIVRCLRRGRPIERMFSSDSDEDRDDWVSEGIESEVSFAVAHLTVAIPWFKRRASRERLCMAHGVVLHHTSDLQRASGPFSLTAAVLASSLACEVSENAIE